VKELIYQYKLLGRKRVGLVFGDQMGRALHETYNGLTVIPVPPRPASLRKRGWDHVDQLCVVLEKRYGIRALRCLKRVGGGPQKALGFEDRQSNIASARISINPKLVPSKVASEAVLIDDIFTTGATANECARVLKSSGFERVRVLTLALD
jgi:predicted amidophosphoribosyltransferase